MGQNMSIEKLQIIMRTGFLERFGKQMMYCTDPVADFGVVYDKQEKITYRKKKRIAKYGMTSKKVPVWKMTLNKTTHGGVAGMGDEEFLKGNIMAFYYIHQRMFDYQKLSKQDISSLMVRLCEGIYRDNLKTGTKLDPVYIDGQGKWDLTVKHAWKMIDRVEKPEGFCTMTNIFPMDKVGRREIGMAKARKVTHRVIDQVRQGMDEIERWQDKLVIEDVLEGVGLMISKYSINKYYTEYLGLNTRGKLYSWVLDIFLHREVNSIDDLAYHMGLTPRRALSMLKGSAWKPTKVERLDKKLTSLILSAKTKSEVIKDSGVGRTTVYRRLESNESLKMLWNQI